MKHQIVVVQVPQVLHSLKGQREVLIREQFEAECSMLRSGQQKLRKVRNLSNND